MKTARMLSVGLAAGVWLACSEGSPDSITGPGLSARRDRPQGAQGLARAIAAQQRHTTALMRMPGVVGTAVGRTTGGGYVVRVFLSSSVAGLPAALDDIPVAAEVTGMFMALTDPTTRARPAPLGFSVGHPNITAGTIGARVTNGSGGVFILSNNHVLANSNDASIGDPTLQPGAFDGGTVANDQIGTLHAFRAIDFSSSGANTMDAALASVASGDLGNATPLDDGYGAPNARIFGDANGDGLFDDRNALLGLNVQKYGRTTKLTHGQITGINATVTVCYESFFGFCIKSARFVDQVVVTPGSFSGGGDSGSLIVTDDANANPVGLLFAGSSTQTIANRIDLVLTHFGVSVDGGREPPPPPPPPTPVTDIAIQNVSAPSSVTQGATASVVVTIQNVGNQDVATSFDVTLRDVTDAATLGTQSVAGLAAGATTTRTYSWNTTGSSIGPHTLTASHSFSDGNAANDQGSTTSTVNAPGSDMHVGDLDGFASDDGTTWSAIVEITIHDAGHAPLNGVTVVGSWNRSGLNSDTCTTGEGGGNGTCIVLFPGLRRNVKFVTFTVSSVSMNGRTYQASANHDADGSSDGTTQRVNRP